MKKIPQQPKRLGRPKADLGRDLRADLLRTSLELLNEGGPGALSMREVARRVGCTHQAPYHYFEDRASLLATLVCDGFEELTQALHAAHEQAATHSLRATLVASAKAYVNFALNHPGIFRIMFRPDMCDPAWFTQVEEAGARAHAELERLNQMIYGETARLSTATLLWAHVHGLSCLLLDSSLSTCLGGAAQQSAHVCEVSEQFADQVLGLQDQQSGGHPRPYSGTS